VAEAQFHQHPRCQLTDLLLGWADHPPGTHEEAKARETQTDGSGNHDSDLGTVATTTEEPRLAVPLPRQYVGQVPPSKLACIGIFLRRRSSEPVHVRMF